MKLEGGLDSEQTTKLFKMFNYCEHQCCYTINTINRNPSTSVIIRIFVSEIAQRSVIFLSLCFFLQVERGFRAVHVAGVELKHMGQQSLGHYPVHFHMNGDVDDKGGYNPPTYVKDLSIHHSFSRCVTIHGSNGLLVSFRPEVVCA